MGVVSRRCVCLVGVVVRRYIDFPIYVSLLLLYLFFFAAASLLFVHKKKCFSFFILYFKPYVLASKKCFYVYLNTRPMRYSAMQI